MFDAVYDTTLITHAAGIMAWLTSNKGCCPDKMGHNYTIIVISGLSCKLVIYVYKAIVKAKTDNFIRVFYNLHMEIYWHKW